jgi:hypothetical protein
MIYLRLVKSRINNYALLLDSITIPDLDSLYEIYIIARTAGKLLKPYMESLKDTNIVSSLLDESIKEWNWSDITSLQFSLVSSGLGLIITQESGEDLEFTSAQVKFLMVDSSTRFLGAIPYGLSVVEDRREVSEKISIIDVLDSMLSNYNYFSQKKFAKNPIKENLGMLKESRNLTKSVNDYAMNRLFRMLDSLDKKIITLSKS